jgi:fructose-1,6-bisphosphatase/inositol monophosphatase family enzyme
VKAGRVVRETPEPGAFIARLAPALRQAASIASALEGRVANRPKHGETTDIKAALTIADTAAQEAILVPLYEHFPNVGLAAEEDTPSVARFPERQDVRVVLDPIDGTLRFYLEGRGPYAVMVGMAVEDEYQAALVALPRDGIFLDATLGGGARISTGDTAPEPVRLGSTGRGVLVSHDLPDPARAVLSERGYDVRPASGGAISVAPLLPGVCAGLRLMRTDPGNVSIRGRIGALIATEAGAVVATRTGEPFPRNIEVHEPAMLVARDGSVLSDLCDALTAADSG